MTIFSTRNIIIFSVISLICASVAFYVFNSSGSKEVIDSQHKGSKTSYDDGLMDEKYETVKSDVLKVSDSEFVLGNKRAKVTFIDYASMSCPHCASFYNDAFDQLKEEYIDTGKVKFVYRDFPLNQPSLVAAAIAICRAEELDQEERVEGYHDFVSVMYSTQNSWIFKEDFAEKLESIAVLEGMDKDLVKKCAKDVKLHEKILRARMIAAKELQIQSTPTFFVNNKKIQGFVGYKKIKELIEYELNK